MKRQLASVSPWILAAAFALLAFIIGAFAVSNYTREKALMTEVLLQQGLAVIRFLDTGVRVSIRAGWLGRGDGGSAWTSHVQSVIDQLRDQPDIHYVELLDGSGTILAGNVDERIGMEKEPETLQFIRDGLGEKPVFRFHRNAEGDLLGFQVAQSFRPRLRGPMMSNGPRGRMMLEGMRRMMPEVEQLQQELEKLQGQEFTLLVELDTAKFSRAVQAQLLQIVILSVVLLLVGAGGWLSLLTLQGFKGTQSRLKRIRAFNDMLVEALPVGLIATDGAGAIRVVNDAAMQMVGSEVAGLIGRNPAEALPPLLANQFALPGNGQARPLFSEGTIESPDGTSRSLYLTAISVLDEKGGSIGDVLLLQDVTHLRELESELRRNERLAALGRVAAGVAHELRNPLSSIKGLAVLLKGRVGRDAEGRQTADVLVQEVERLNRSISELLDYARPEKLQLASVPLQALLEKAINLVGVDAAELGVRIISSFAAGNDQVSVDADRMNQVFLNLLLNAIQAMPEGGELRIVTEREGNRLVCLIEDNGEGIAEENLPRVFDPYFTTKSTGTGLGLALSAKIVEEHGGSVVISSRLGQGTRVSVQLPAAPVAKLHTPVNDYAA